MPRLTTCGTANVCGQGERHRVCILTVDVVGTAARDATDAKNPQKHEIVVDVDARREAKSLRLA